MTELFCYENSYMKYCDSTVVRASENEVVLDRTVFYPGGGGQPCDTGALYWDDGICNVTRVRRSGDDLIHEIKGDCPTVGTVVRVEIDWDKRYELMRTHTALHILCGVIWRDFGALVTGGNMTPLAARMDFELEHMSSEFAIQVEELINLEVYRERDIYVKNIPRKEALKIPDLIRMKVNKLPPTIAEVRIVDISGLDLQADGGTHVANTKEVGKISVVGHQSKGRINKRLRISLDK